MIEHIRSVFLGLIQGVSEFLPVSSSGHLLIFHEMFGKTSNTLALDATLHLATALALLIYFRKDWYEIVTNTHSSVLKLITIASIPAMLIGVLFKDVIENSLRGSWIVVTMLVLVGLLMLLVDKTKGNGNRKFIKLSLNATIFIGLMQAVALIPGTSRAGITLIAGLIVGLSRKEALRFAFLLGMPLTLVAGIFQIEDSLPIPDLLNTSYSLVDIFLAFGVAFVSGIFVIGWLLKFVENHSLLLFVVYRFILAGLIAIYTLRT